MELVAASITGWRRFATKTNLQTNGKLVSFLGPNEAGKSSLLEALRFLGTAEGAQSGDFARDADPASLLIVGFFCLTQEEREESGLTVPSRLILTKGATGAATLSIEPAPAARSTEARDKTCSQLDKAIRNKKFSEFLKDEEMENLVNTLNSIRSTIDEDFSSDLLAVINRCSNSLKQLNLYSFPQYIKNLSEVLDGLYEFEVAPNPTERALAVLEDKIPPILLFGAGDRDLRHEYDFDDLASNIPRALENLASIASLDLKALVDAVDEDDAPKIETIRVRANKALKKRFKEAWSQSGVTVSLVIRDRVLNVLIENENDQYTALAERSDGFRQFVALQSFAMKEHASEPILLIDEAELHLHYDAQADLVQMLSKQKVAKKIIYTTHSAGCLPEDLGNGVRLVLPDQKNSAVSKVVNRFWGSEEPGFSPLLIGMGASTLAFFPIRRALMVEGETEMLLLPSLIREALSVDTLGFQIVPGLSKADKSRLPTLGSKAGHVGYLVDGDGGGKGLQIELRKQKISEESIFVLPSPEGQESEIEDFVSPAILLKSLNILAQKFTPGCATIKIPTLSGPARSVVLSSAYQKVTKKVLSKTDLAYEVLGLLNAGEPIKIIDAGKRKAFVALCGKIRKYFEKSSE